MSRYELELVSVTSSDAMKPPKTDFKVGRYYLAKHFATNQIASVSVDRKYARQLLLKSPSDFESGRVPLYVCELCGDLECGALTVRVDRTESGYRWSEFGWEGPDSPSFSASDRFARTGPFDFESDTYESALGPYT